MHVPPTQNHMFIVMPFSTESLGGLFRTHPSTERRIANLLKQMNLDAANPYARLA